MTDAHKTDYIWALSQVFDEEPCQARTIIAHGVKDIVEDEVVR